MEQLTTKDYLIHIDKHPKSVYVLHEKSERKFSVHKHKKGQLTYVEGGLAYVFIRGNTFVIPARHYIWIPPGMDHVLKIRHKAAAIRTIYFYDDDKDDFYQQMGMYPISNLLHEMIIYTEKWRGDIEPGNQNFSFLKALKTLLPESRTQKLPIVLPTTNNERLRPVLQYLYTTYGQQHTLKSLSEHFGYSERTLSRLFQSALSISFLQYLKQLRMIKAVVMMLQTDLTLSQIAFATGYSSISAFSNTFFQLTHRRPSEFAATVR